MSCKSDSSIIGREEYMLLDLGLLYVILVTDLFVVTFGEVDIGIADRTANGEI